MTDASVVVNAVDLSDRVTSVTLNYDVDAVEVTAMSDGSRKYVGGLANISCTIDFQQDFAATETNATIYALVGTTTTLEIKPTSDTTSATNPEYTITGAYVASHQVLSGSVGDLAVTSVEFQGGVLTEATS